ncbi:MAG: hydrogenase formation protein HypD [Bacteroidales bacterium]|nr:hydrogenase formation protein HypD [Bacteroidales bacterium]
MKYIDEYRDKDLILKMAGLIKKSASRNYTFMEVCGGHTAAIHRFGIPSLLPENIRLISGPGCPVCVTATDYIDKAIVLAETKDAIIATFGDLMRVPGSESSLEKKKAEGADIRVLFSGLDALEIAEVNPDRRVIFLGIGFETTAPGTAVALMQARGKRLRNFFLLSAHKVMPPAMRAVIKDGMKIDGFICPGHVATITGSSAFDFIPREYKKACVVTGFEPLDIMQAILMLIHQVNSELPTLEIQYKRAVTPDGNRIAQDNLLRVFVHNDTEWRGFGIIPLSGLKPGPGFGEFDAEKVFNPSVRESRSNPVCICGEVLRGVKTPSECPLFATACTPLSPEGACMVSNEGACNTFYKYRPDG